MEIERKWFLPTTHEIGDLFFDAAKIDPNYSTSYQVQQFYVSRNPEVRLGKAINPDGSTRYIKMTVKGNGSLSRFENMHEFPEESYDHLLQAVPQNKVIHKQYVKIPFRFLDQFLELEYSLVDNSWAYCEIEFHTEKEARSFEAPRHWVEVTHLNCFKMKNYAQNKAKFLFLKSIYTAWINLKRTFQYN